MSDDAPNTIAPAPEASAPASAPAPPAPAPEAKPAEAPAPPLVDPELAALRARSTRMESVLAAHSEQVLATLSERQRAIILKEAGEDHVERLRLVTLVQSLGAVAPAPPPVPVGASTAPAPAAPAAATPDPDAAILAEYKRLAAVAPTHAQLFAGQNAAALKRARARAAS